MKPIYDDNEALMAFELTNDESEAFDFGCELMLRSLNTELNDDPKKYEDLQLREGIEDFVEIRKDIADGERFLTRPGEWYLASCAMRLTVHFFNWSNLPNQDITRNCQAMGIEPSQLVSYWIDANRMLSIFEGNDINSQLK